MDVLQLRRLVLLLLATGTVLGLDIQNCVSPLGMEDGRITDKQLSATSSSRGTCTAKHARLNRNVLCGGWCPDQNLTRYVNKTGPFYDQYIRVKLDRIVRITGITMQGRAVEGKEKVDQYQLNYSPDVSHPSKAQWIYDKKTGNVKLFLGNKDAKTHTSYIKPPLVGNAIRIVPEIYPDNQVCLRFELLGCSLKDGLVTYSMPQGNVRGGMYNFTDASYDGVIDNEVLSSGLGMLTDGRLASANYVDTNGLGWIGWKDTATPYPYIIFEFLETRIFHSVTLHCNVRDRTKIQLFSKVVVSFNVDGVAYDAFLLHEPDSVSSGYKWMNRNVSVDLCHHVGKFVKLDFTYSGEWILISEVTFNSEPLGSSVPPDLYCASAAIPSVKTVHIPSVKETTTSTSSPNNNNNNNNNNNTLVDDVSGDDPIDGGVIAGIVCAVLAVLLAVALCVCWRLKPRCIFKRQTPFNTFIKVELKPYSHYQAPQRVSRIESSGSDSEEKRYSFKNNVYHSMKGGAGGSEGADVTACPIYASIQDNLINERNGSLRGTDRKSSKKATKPRVPKPLDPVKGSSEAVYTEPTSPLLSASQPSPESSPKPPVPPRASQLGNREDPDISDSGYAEPEGSPTVTNSPFKPAIQGSYAEPIDVIPTPTMNIFPNPIYEEVYAEPYQGVSGTSLYCNPNDELRFRPRVDTFKDFPRGKLQFREKIGDGQFGEVHIGEVENLAEVLGEEFKGDKRVTVAIKTLKANVEKNIKEDFFKEVKVMAGLRHKNVVRLLGVCRDDPMCMIVEYMANGDLNQFLKDRELAPNLVVNECVGEEVNERIISTQALLYMGQQIAAGMKYISSLNYVHRDLATRNCLVGHAYTVKIADFGMSRNLYSKHYYRIEGRVILPIRWMAPECILQGRFTTASDVWAFGVTLWEILTLAREYPYSQFTDEEVIANVQKMFCQVDGQSFTSLPQPNVCADGLYQLMSHCWAKEPGDRPSFREIQSTLGGFATHSEVPV